MPHISDKIGQIHESDIFQLKIQIPDMKFFFSTLGGAKSYVPKYTVTLRASLKSNYKTGNQIIRTGN